MIKVSVLYPNKPGSHFDMAYYINNHMPLAMRLLAKGLRKTEVDAGISGARPGEPPAFFGGCQFYFDSVGAFIEAWSPAAAEITADIPRYTDVAPLIQFNEVKLSL
ncbi:MAG TPA: EthD family reductase [Steroidobacteraceae bacterium]|nr:EthD family reductase [Steroidobacteraceae bacterium]